MALLKEGPLSDSLFIPSLTGRTNMKKWLLVLLTVSFGGRWRVRSALGPRIGNRLDERTCGTLRPGLAE